MPCHECFSRSDPHDAEALRISNFESRNRESKSRTGSRNQELVSDRALSKAVAVRCIPSATSRRYMPCSLLALMCFHGARFDARVAVDGAIALLEEQDRCAWNWSDVREGMAWLARSAAGDELTRYHVEAGIAWEHCRAPTFADTDWRRIAL